MSEDAARRSSRPRLAHPMPGSRLGAEGGPSRRSAGPGITRRRTLRLGAGALAATVLGPSMLTGSPRGGPGRQELITGRIPSSGEVIPAVGLGTWQTFDVGASRGAREPLRQVLRAFVELGGTVVDSSPMYGRSQEVLGDLAAELGVLEDLWVATKVWTEGREEGREQMEASMAELRRSRIELMQVHNLVDAATHLDTLAEWKAGGRIDYVGITTSSERQYDEVARLLDDDRLDFLQVNYSLAERRSAERVLPKARDRGIAVMLNRPFAGGRLFSRFQGEPLPGWASEIDCEAWSQIFLKYVLSHPAVTCAIPATSDPDHLRENMDGGRGRLPGRDLRRRMEGLMG